MCIRDRCIGWSTASAVQLRVGNQTALAAEVTETLPQALKRDPRIDGSYARLKAGSTHRLYTRCETAIATAATYAHQPMPRRCTHACLQSAVSLARLGMGLTVFGAGIACDRRGHHRLSGCLQSHRDRTAGEIGLVANADLRIS